MFPRTESESWFLDHVMGGLAEKEIVSSAEVVKFMKAFWPFMESYFSPLTPQFSFQGIPSSFTGRKVFMLRDGAIPLSWFFRSVSADSIPVSLLIHRDLAPLVSAQWMEKVKFYQHVSLVPFKPRASYSSLLICGPVSLDVIDLDQLEETFDRVQAVLGKKRLQGMKIQMFCPIRNQYSGQDCFELSYLSKIFERFGTRVKAVEWATLENIGSLSETLYCELNGGWLYKDSYLMHAILEKGATLLSVHNQIVTKKKEILPLSRSHGIEILDRPPVEDLLSQAPEGLSTFYMSISKRAKARAEMFWPAWYEKWCRASLSLRQSSSGKVKG